MKNGPNKIESLIAPIISAMGFEVWNVEMRKTSHRTLLIVYVDVPQGDDRKYVSVDDCSQISKQLGAFLDVESPISGSYVLEVSSPGLNRSLSKLEHYQRYVGSIIRVVLKETEDEKSSFIGKIQEVFDDTVKLLVDNNEVITLLLTNIKKANLVPCF